MYKYTITITQQVLNPNYEEEMEIYGKNTKNFKNGNFKS